MAFNFFKKVVIKIRVTGEDLDKIRSILDRLESLGKATFTESYIERSLTPAPGSTRDMDTSNAYTIRGYLRDLAEAKARSDRLKENQTMAIDSEAFTKLVDLVRSGMFMGHRHFRDRKEIVVQRESLHELARYLDDMIRRVMHEESLYLRTLHEDLETLEHLPA